MPGSFSHFRTFRVIITADMLGPPARGRYQMIGLAKTASSQRDNTRTAHSCTMLLPFMHRVALLSSIVSVVFSFPPPVFSSTAVRTRRWPTGRELPRTAAADVSQLRRDDPAAVAASGEGTSADPRSYHLDEPGTTSSVLARITPCWAALLLVKNLLGMEILRGLGLGRGRGQLLAGLVSPPPPCRIAALF